MLNEMCYINYHDTSKGIKLIESIVDFEIIVNCNNIPAALFLD